MQKRMSHMMTCSDLLLVGLATGVSPTVPEVDILVLTTFLFVFFDR